MRIDLNADLGEGVGDDAALLDVVTSANIATGAHAGGGAVLAATVAAAVARGAQVGAHPSYRDRAGFGRRSMLERIRQDAAAREALREDLVAQVLSVAAAAVEHGAALRHVKAHGALYNDAVADECAAGVVATAVREVAERCASPVWVVTQPRGALADVADSLGLDVLDEGFVDRAYLPSGALVPRDEPGAVLSDVPTMVAQALQLAAGQVQAVTGQRIPMPVGTLCVHGDTPGALAAAQAVREALASAGWRLAAPDLRS